jgi:ankyrin repeat protein
MIARREATASSQGDLFEAIEASDLRAIRALVADEPGLAVGRDEHGVSALMRALYRSDPATVEPIRELVRELDVFEAAAFGDEPRLQQLLDAEPALVSSYSADGFTALHFAAFFGHAGAVELLLAHGAEVDAFGRGWMTGTSLHSAVSRKWSEIARRLLEAGANPNARQSAGWTPLHSAAHNGDLASIDLLVAAGADPSATNDEGRSVLELAEERDDPAAAERIRAALQAAP